MIARAEVKIPAAPTPERARPKISVFMFIATAQTIDPSSNNVIAAYKERGEIEQESDEDAWQMVKPSRHI
jgi:hypothetical protein